MHDYYEHLKKFGFTWEIKNLDIKYGIRMNNTDDKKLKKQLTMSSKTRIKSVLDEYRVWNMTSDLKMRKFFMIGYLYDTRIMDSMLGITGLSMNLRNLSTVQKMVT